MLAWLRWTWTCSDPMCTVAKTKIVIDTRVHSMLGRKGARYYIFFLISSIIELGSYGCYADFFRYTGLYEAPVGYISSTTSHSVSKYRTRLETRHATAPLFLQGNPLELCISQCEVHVLLCLCRGALQQIVDCDVDNLLVCQ